MHVAFNRAGHSDVHFKHLMQDVHQQQHGVTTVKEDNNGATKLANNSPMASSMTTHIVIKHHNIRQVVVAKTIAIVSVDIVDIIMANGPTKALPTLSHAVSPCTG
jgi:predicted ATPase